MIPFPFDMSSSHSCFSSANWEFPLRTSSYTALSSYFQAVLPSLLRRDEECLAFENLSNCILTMQLVQQKSSPQINFCLLLKSWTIASTVSLTLPQNNLVITACPKSRQPGFQAHLSFSFTFKPSSPPSQKHALATQLEARLKWRHAPPILLEAGSEKYKMYQDNKLRETA